MAWPASTSPLFKKGCILGCIPRGAFLGWYLIGLEQEQIALWGGVHVLTHPVLFTNPFPTAEK